MALTVAQLNAHIRTICQDQLQAERNTNEAVFVFFMRACIRHHRLGGADNIEAARTVAQFVFQEIIGRTPTAEDLHYLRTHFIPDMVDRTGTGLL